MIPLLHKYIFAVSVLFSLVQANISLKYPTKRTKLFNYSVTVFEDRDAINKTWVEYKLLLRKSNIQKSMSQTLLTVGVPMNTYFSPDCYIQNESNGFEGYSLRVIWELQRILHFG